MKIKLISFELAELREKETEIKFKDLSTGDFNLLIGDNAQGKTRLFRILNFLSNLFKDKPKIMVDRTTTIGDKYGKKGLANQRVQ